MRALERKPLVLVFSILAVLAFYACGKQAPASFERPPAPVTVTAALQRDVPDYLDQIGKFVAREVVSIQPQVSGRIVKIHFTDGANVAAGQVLFTIDPRPFEAQLNVAEANLQEARAALDLAKSNFARVESRSEERRVGERV